MSSDQAESAASERRRIEAELLDWMAEPEWRSDDERFSDLASRLFAYQFEACLPYRRLCEMRGKTPGRIASWHEIPAVPTGAFKEMPLRCFPEHDTAKVFRTSGTSDTRRGELWLDGLALYEASLLSSLRHGLFPEQRGERWQLPMRVLAPSPGEAPDSSLSHMFGVLMNRHGAPGSGFDVVSGVLQVEPLLRILRRVAQDGQEMVLAGTAFAFVHLLDAMAAAGRGADLVLPAGSRIMETGGFKGRSRVIERSALYRELEQHLGVAPARCVNQYGMTELGSQFYDSVLREPASPRRKCSPPWTRVRIVDPETGAEPTPGETGMIVIHDLANTGSVAAIQTADLGRAIGDGFEVLGRAEGAEARGCSLAADVMLAGGRLEGGAR